MKFKDKLGRLGACTPALDWLKNRGAQKAWDECERADWMLWLAARTLPRQQVVLLACDCAATVLKHSKGTHAEDPARKAIKTARAWARGKASLEDVRTATYAADAAVPAAAAYAADAAAYAADAADAAAYAAYAADYAADAAAYAAADAAAERRKARGRAHRRMCQLIRKRCPRVPQVKLK